VGLMGIADKTVDHGYTSGHHRWIWVVSKTA
jgi:hypothetical protein